MIGSSSRRETFSRCKTDHSTHKTQLSGSQRELYNLLGHTVSSSCSLFEFSVNVVPLMSHDSDHSTYTYADLDIII